MAAEPITHARTHADGRARCAWCGHDPLYVRYHDAEWGVPERDGRALFALLVLESFQAGLSWLTILRKRENFRRALDGFDPARIAGYGAAKLDALMADAGLVRHRGKIAALPRAAEAVLRLEEGPGLALHLWSFVGGRPRQEEWPEGAARPTASAASRLLAQDLRARGVSFFGPTTAHAFMQAAGLLNGHAPGCFRRDEVAALAAGFRPAAGPAGP